MIDHDTADPLYLQIRDAIVDDIQSGRYVAHQRLPSERELSAAHGVSRMTVRQALVDLQRSGAVYSRVGKGTFVAASKIGQQLRLVTSFTHEARERGGVPSSRVLRADIVTAPDDALGPLGLAAHERVVVLARVRLINDEPYAIETAFIPDASFPRLLEHDFGHESLYAVLAEDYRVTLAAAEQTIEAGLADAEELAALGLQHPAAVLRMRRLSRATTGRAVEYVRSTYRGDRYQLHSALAPSALLDASGSA